MSPGPHKNQLMIQENFSITPQGDHECRLKVECTGTTADVEAVNAWLRSLPASQKPFFKECRLKAMIPLYLPVGDFQAQETALTLDEDQLDWMLKNHPEFSAHDDTANNHLSTGGKIISVGGAA